jgi:hypothetical protein
MILSTATPFFCKRIRTPEDSDATEQALTPLRKGIEFLRVLPFSCRKAVAENPLLRELLIPFAQSGYVVLCEIDSADSVTILAARHHREDDYY